jgi:hypothetical protein
MVYQALTAMMVIDCEVPVMTQALYLTQCFRAPSVISAID